MEVIVSGVVEPSPEPQLFSLAEPDLIRIQHKMKYKNQIIENEKFWETVLLLTLKMQDFVQFFFS